MAVSEAPQREDLDKCVHCGLCLNACPTYRELGLEMDSPRGRVYQMVQVSNGAPITPSYEEHIALCLACRGCESACPSGVPYGRMVEDARCQIESQVKRGLAAAGVMLYLSEKAGLKGLMRVLGFCHWGGRLGEIAQLALSAEPP